MTIGASNEPVKRPSIAAPNEPLLVTIEARPDHATLAAGALLNARDRDSFVTAARSSDLA